MSEEKTRLVVRRVYSVRELHLDKAFEQRIDDVDTAWGFPTDEEVVRGFDKATVFCTGSCSRPINSRMRESLAVLAAGRLPPGSAEWVTLGFGTKVAGSELGKIIPPLSILPASIRSALGDAGSKIAQAVRRAVELVRWRSGSDGQYQPLSAIVNQDRWSTDGVNWHQLPTDTYAVSETDSWKELGDAVVGDLRDLADGKWTEPVGHSLWREAWKLRNLAPRSALVIGVASAEVAFKELVSDLVPDAGWIVQNAPSPPLVKMLSEYLPSLPARNKFDEKVLPPSKSTLDVLKKAVAQRNKATHVGQTVKTDSVEQTLLSIRSILWLLDYYRGHRWALSHMEVMPDGCRAD